MEIKYDSLTIMCVYIYRYSLFIYKYMNCRRKELSMRMCPYCGHEGLNSGSYCSYCGRIHNVSTSLDKYNLGLIENCKRCLIYKYADFEGRASRGEYWHFLLMYQLLFVATLFICAFLSYISPLSSIVGVGVGLVLLVLISVAVAIPGVAVAVRRLHDQGRSGVFVFINIIPLIGTVIFFILMAMPGESTENRFGMPTGYMRMTKRMAHEMGLIDASPTMNLIVGIICTIVVLWFFVDRLIMA